MSDIRIRFATADDVGVLLQFIRELAAYERMPDAVSASEDDLLRYGFGPEQRFEAIIAFVEDRPAGFALFFADFSTWRGRPRPFFSGIFFWGGGRPPCVGR